MEDSVIGKEVDGYRIQEVLGRGGMGVVYKAEDVGLSRNVALKRIDPSMANDEAFLRRFRSEAQALARIDSLYIVSVHALRETEIGLLIVMEYVEGGTVQDLVEKGPMGWQEAVPLTKQMLTALEHAHSAEVIHRDIKPQNVMLSAEGTVKVTDFGLAKVHRPDSNKTVTQGVFGTLNYMSPEQVKGSGDLDHRSDLYSLGMTVYEMLAGDLPFDEDSNEFTKMQRIVQEELPPPTELHPQVPEDLSGLVMKSLEKDPDDRFQSAQEMREAFEAFEKKHREEKEQTSPPATKAQLPETEAHPTATAAQPAAVGAPSPATEAQPTAEEASASSPVARWPLVTGLAVLVLLVAGGGGYWLLTTNGMLGAEGPSSGTESESSGPSPTRLSVATEPSGATLALEGNWIGEAPLDTTLEAGGKYRVRATMAGRDTTDTTVTLAQNGPSRFTLQPEPLETDDSADDESTDEALADNAPPTDDSPSNTSTDGDPTGSGAADNATPAGNSQPDAPRNDDPPEEEPAYGALTLNASPPGSVSASVDGDTRELGQSIQVRTGSRQIRITHPDRGACERTLTVQEGESQTLTCHFEHQVIVRSRPWANVYIDGENTGEQTQHSTRLATGRTYEIGVNIQRGSYVISGGTYVRRGEESGVLEKRDFSGSTMTISPQPSFEPQTHGIGFQVSESEP